MKQNFRSLSTAGGWLVFLISFVVYYLSAERTGSLWDCGEFILGAYKLQVVHPPGAPLFLILGRLFAWVGDVSSSDPSTIAFMVNVLSAMSSAAAAMMVAWTTMIFSRLAMFGRDGTPEGNEQWVIVGSGIVAGLATAFSTSIWFSAVEGEVYALSTFFTTLTLWATVKWYGLPNKADHDRWLIFALYCAGLSIGVHLLSILTFPAIGLFYYFKKYKKHTWLGAFVAMGVGVAVLGLIQGLIITGIPKLWTGLELLMVNSFGLPFHSGLIPLLLIIGGVLYLGYRYAHRTHNGMIQNIMVGLSLVLVSYSIIGVVVIRANANPPINMNAPTDAFRLLPYLNREQYGERPLLKGPYFDANAVSTETEDRYGRVGDRYEIVDYKITPKYRTADEMLFPRMSHNDPNRRQLYRIWMEDTRNTGKPSMADNLEFFWKYQIKWMYWRYFMWNFSGRQNGDQGYFSWDLRKGNWQTGLPLVDDILLYNQKELPDVMKNDKARNNYFLLPFIFGIVGLIYQYKKRQKDFLGLLALFLITGIGIIIYSNQPPNEPRERDYVLVGSFFTFCIWIGLAVPAMYGALKRLASTSAVRMGVSLGLVLLAPIIMGVQNFDDHSRRHLSGARDYAHNFLESCDPNAIIFTYGDNDTYPLWYAQEVEGIRTDVRVVNLSLIAVDWYINQERRMINKSPGINLSISEDDYRGSKRNVLRPHPQGDNREMALSTALRFMGEYHPLPMSGGREFQSYIPSTNLYFDIDKNRAINSGWVTADEADKVVDRVPLKISGSLTKDELAVLDILNNNMYDRPIYFSVTTRQDKLMGLGEYMKLEGLGLRFMPIRTTVQPRDRNFGIHKNGSIDADKIHDKVLNVFKWGGFDTHDQFVSNSFVPSLLAHKTMIERAALELITQGDNTKAIELIDKYFEAFPHMNFPYDAQILNMLRMYDQAGAYDKAKEKMEILDDQTEQYLRFYQSLSPQDLRMGFNGDQKTWLSVADELQRLANANNDTEYANELKAMFDTYRTSAVKG